MKEFIFSNCINLLMLSFALFVILSGIDLLHLRYKEQVRGFLYRTLIGAAAVIIAGFIVLHVEANTALQTDSFREQAQFWKGILSPVYAWAKSCMGGTKGA